MPTLKLLTLISFLVAGAAAAAAADPLPCRADAKKLCPAITPGWGNIVACLLTHGTEISAECKAAVEIRQQKRRAAVDACKPDAEKYCKPVKIDRGRLVRCLESHQQELLPPCARIIEDHKAHLERGKQVCKDDYVKFCKGTKIGGGSLIECMADHAADLSADCGDWLDEAVD